MSNEFVRGERQELTVWKYLFLFSNFFVRILFFEFYIITGKKTENLEKSPQLAIPRSQYAKWQRAHRSNFDKYHNCIPQRFRHARICPAQEFLNTCIE